jgi:dTDP-4-amino-4,6-dideoxygalactose transaminase
LKIPYLPLHRLQSRFVEEDLQVFRQLQESGQYIGGTLLRGFEEDFASFCGVNHCIGAGNGLDALTLILLSEVQLGVLPEGAKILLPAHTYVATFLSILNAGMQPVPVDVSGVVMASADMQSQITDVDGVVVVDIYGKMVDEEVYAFAKAHSKPIYCDTAQSHGAVNASGKVAGSLARASAFSFYPTKNLGALGDGGAVVTDNEALAGMVRKMGNYGRSSRFTYDVKGMNSRLDPLQAGFLSNRLKTLNADQQIRTHCALRYVREIKNPRVRLLNSSFFEYNAIHVFPCFVEDAVDFCTYLSVKEIGTNRHYPIPPNRQEALSVLHHLSFENTERLHKTEVSLPCHALLTDREIDYIIKSINEY